MPQRASQEPVRTPNEWDELAKESLSRSSPSEVESLDVALAVSQFCHYYPGEFRNGEIGWKLFWVLYSCIPHIAALDRLHHFKAEIMAGGMIHSNEDGKRTVQRMYDEDVSTAQGKV